MAVLGAQGRLATLGSMSTLGTALLSFLPPATNMNGLICVKRLQEMLNIHMAVHITFIFMHDGTPESGEIATALSKWEQRGRRCLFVTAS